MSLAKIHVIRTSAIARTIALPAWSGGAGLFILMSLGLLILSMARPNIIQNARSVLYDVSAPILLTISAPIQSASTAFQDATGLASMKAENARLRKEVEQLSALRMKAATLGDENVRLRSLLHVSAPPKFNYVSAPIISDSASAFSKTILVKAGQNDGVQKGQIALDSSGMIGRVVEASSAASRILLVSDINTKVPVIIGKSGANAIISGTNNGAGKILYAQDNAKISNGDHVVTSGRGGLLPYGIPVGKIFELKNNKDGQRFGVEFYSNVNNASHVRIVTSPISSDIKELVSKTASRR